MHVSLPHEGERDWTIDSNKAAAKQASHSSIRARQLSSKPQSIVMGYAPFAVSNHFVSVDRAAREKNKEEAEFIVSRIETIILQPTHSEENIASYPEWQWRKLQRNRIDTALRGDTSVDPPSVRSNQLAIAL